MVTHPNDYPHPGRIMHRKGQTYIWHCHHVKDNIYTMIWTWGTARRNLPATHIKTLVSILSPQSEPSHVSVPGSPSTHCTGMTERNFASPLWASAAEWVAGLQRGHVNQGNTKTVCVQVTATENTLSVCSVRMGALFIFNVAILRKERKKHSKSILISK